MKLRIFSLILISSLLFVSCATCPENIKEELKTDQKDLMEFEAGIRYLAKDVFCKLLKDSSVMKKKNIVLEKIENVDVADESEMKSDIESLMKNEIEKQEIFNKNFNIVSSSSSIQRDYLLRSKLLYEYFDGRKRPHLKIHVEDNKQEVKAEASVWFASLFDCQISEQERKDAKDKLYNFADGIRYLAKEMLCKLFEDSLFFPKKKRIIFNSIFSKDTGYQFEYQKKIELLIMKELGDYFDFIPKTDTETQPDYIIEWMISLESRSDTPESERKFPHLIVSIADMRKEKGEHATDIQFKEREIDMTSPISEREDPFFRTDKTWEDTKKITEGNKEEPLPDNYHTKLRSDRFMMKGDVFLREKRYDDAKKCYQTVIEINDREEVKEVYSERAYSQLVYISLYHEGNQKEADRYALQRLNSRLVHKSNFDMKILFKPNSVEMLEEKKGTISSYIKALGERLEKKPDQCVIITGHCSKTGDVWTNCALSENRANTIANLIKDEFPNTKEKLIVVGRSFLQTENGIPSDSDVRSQKDRRVEFNLIKCGEQTENTAKCEEYAEQKGYKRLSITP